MGKSINPRFKMLKHQKAFFDIDGGEVGLVGGFRSGKSKVAIWKGFKCMLTKVNRQGRSHGLMGGIDHITTMNLLFYPMCDLLDELGIKYEARIADRQIITQFGDIIFRPLNTAEKYVGFELTWAIFDEFDLAGWANCELAYRKIIARFSGCENPFLGITTTYEGFLYTHFLFEKDNELGKRTLIRARSQDNPFLPADYIDKMKAIYPPKLIDMYLNGFAQNITSGSVYYEFDPDIHIDNSLKIDSRKPLHIGMDFNVDPMTATVSQLSSKDGLRIEKDTLVYTLDEVWLKDGNTPAMIKYLFNHFPNSQFKIYPDSTGNARSTSNAASETDIKLLREAFGDASVVVSANPPEIDRATVVNRLFRDGFGVSKHLINGDKCKHLVDDLLYVTWQEGVRKINKSSQERTHISDALGYFLYRKFGLYSHSELQSYNTGNLTQRQVMTAIPTGASGRVNLKGF
jgi:hypothetical protein